MKKTKILIFPIFLTVILGAFALIAFSSEYQIRKHGVVTEGIVIDHALENTQKTPSKIPDWYPIVEFYTEGRQKLNAKFPHGNPERTPAVGHKLKIIYTVMNPTQIVSAEHPYFIPSWIFVTLAVIWGATILILKKTAIKK